MTSNDQLANRQTASKTARRADRLRAAASPSQAILVSKAGAQPQPERFRSARRRWAIVFGQYALAAALTLALVSKLLFLWTADLRRPCFGYEGDAVLFHTWCRAIVDHGWWLHNPNLGAPSTQSMEDFPQADNLNVLLVKFFALFSGDTQLVINLFCLATFVLPALTALAVLRHFRVAYPPALACSLLYTFLPYHFIRINGHHFLCCYYVVPFSVMLTIQLFRGSLPWSARNLHAEEQAPAGDTRRALAVRWLVGATICLLQAAAGIYYAFFACYFLAIAGASAGLRRRSFQPLLIASVLVGITVGGVLANLAPNFLYWHKHGVNHEIARRSPQETEAFGFKITQMLLPIPHHRLAAAANLRQRYDANNMTNNESSWSAQGLTANVGFVVLLGLLLYRKPLPQLLEALSVLNIFGVLFATTGGLGMMFSLLISPMIRSQNRVSVFLSFFSLACVAFLLNLVWNRFATTHRRQHLFNGLLIGMVCLALWDQHPGQCRQQYGEVRRQWTYDANFVAKIEAALPPASMVFQLPYVQYPEAPPAHSYSAWQGIRFSLHSHALRWSCGAMRGRDADRWQREVAALPIAEQLKRVAAAGFRGIQVNRLGYVDNAIELERQLHELLGGEPIVSENRLDAFFSLPGSGPGSFANANAQ